MSGPALAAAIAATPLAAQPAATATVAGVVWSERGARIAGAQVRLVGAATSVAVTGDDGAFRFGGVAGGTAQLVVRRIGFRPETVSVDVPMPPGGPIAIPLAPLATPLGAVVVKGLPRPAGGPFAEFNRRRAKGFGQYVTRQEIERRRPARVSDLFRSIPNLTVERSGSVNVVRMRGRTCDPLVWADGQPLVGGFLDLDAVAPGSIEGIEIYSGVSTIPPELIGPRDAGGCGVIVVWTRHGENTRRPSRAVTAAELASLVDARRVYTADQVDDRATPMPGFLAGPAYPDSLRLARVAGEVLAEFVVDAEGRVEQETIGVVLATHPALADAVRRALPGARFVPARRDGRSVRQVVHLPFRFAPAGGARADSAP